MNDHKRPESPFVAAVVPSAVEYLEYRVHASGIDMSVAVDGDRQLIVDVWEDQAVALSKNA